MFLKQFSLIILACAALLGAATAADIEVTQVAKVRIVPIALQGYTGEAAAVLRFDLEIAGFEVTDPEKAQYVLSGKNDATQVEGRLQDRISKASLLAKAYTGGTTRSQAHSLADEIVSLILRTPGVASTKMVFKQESGNGSSEILVSDYDGHNARAVTQDGVITAAPAWLPKRWHLFYTSYKSGYPWIYSHNLATGERKPFARFPGLNSSAVVSPDGTKVAMVLSKAGSPDIWVAQIDGTGLTQITKTREDESSPCWSPDGSKICFASRLNERRGLFTVSSSGGPLTRVDTGGEPNPTEPDWSPDGKTIAFTSQPRSGFNICVVPAQGGVTEALVAGEDPSWAPNSRTLVFTRRVGNKRVLSLLDVPTKRVKDTAQISGNRSQPSWAK